MLELKDISKKLDTFTLRKTSFAVEKGEYFILLGESGVGKTVILEIIAGLIKPDTGSVLKNQTDLGNLSLKNRGIGLVYQDQALFPNMTVRENIAFPMKARSLSRDAIQSKLEELARKMGISDILNQSTTTLSIGQAQRTALARTLSSDPEILLLDEPLSSLDVQAKSELRKLLREINKNGQTIIHVTHDYEEAIALGSRIAVMENGSISQVGSPDDVFHHPKSEFIARFTGIKNFFRGELLHDETQTKAFLSDTAKLYVMTDNPPSKGFLIIDGEDVTISNEQTRTSARNSFKGIITGIEKVRVGIEIIIESEIKISAHISKSSLTTLDLYQGKEVWASFKASAARFIKE